MKYENIITPAEEAKIIASKYDYEAYLKEINRAILNSAKSSCFNCYYWVTESYDFVTSLRRILRSKGYSVQQYRNPNDQLKGWWLYISWE